MTGQLDEILGLVNAIKKDEEALETKDLDAVVGAATTLGMSRARDNLAFVVIVAYIATLCVVIIYLAIDGWLREADAFENMIEIVKVGFLPIVTLVIGFYFGSKAEPSKLDSPKPELE